MIFTELVLENFGAYGGKQVINLRPEKDNNIRPIILLGGMNGGGKTTLMDAIRLALYGQRAKCSTRGSLGYGDFLIQSINSRATSGELTKIELTFEHIVNDKWTIFKIIRAWNRDLKDGKESLSILVENNYDRNLEYTWDEYIENILPLGISNLFLFDGEQVKELAELETPPQNVVDAINALLGLELAERLAVDLEVLVSRKRKAVANRSQLATIAEIEEKLEAKAEEKQAIVAKKEKVERQLKTAYKKRDRAQNKFRVEGGKIAAERSQLEAKRKGLCDDIEAIRNELVKLADGSLPLMLIKSLLSEARQHGEAELKVRQFQQAKDIIIERDDKLLNFLNEVALPDRYIDKISWFIDRENRLLEDSLAHKKNKLNIDEDILKQLNALISERLPLQQQLALEKIDKIKQLETDVDLTDKQLANAASPEDYRKLDEAVQEAQQQVSEYKADLEVIEKQYNTVDKEIESTKKELKNYSETAIDLSNDKHIIESAAKVQKTLALFREKLTLKKLNKLETEVTECFRYLLHKSNLINRVVIESNTFRLSLYDFQGLEVPKQRLSAGEKQLLAIAFLWGLARVSGKNLPIAIDTPLSRLDSSHRHNLVERYFPTASHQVILLSTDTEIGKVEVTQLREQEAIAREYLLEYDRNKGQTTVKEGYFW